MNTKKEEFLFQVISLFFRVIGRIPPKWRKGIGRLLGSCCFTLDIKHRKIAMQNLFYAFPDQSQDQIHYLALKIFENLVQMILEIAWSLTLDEKELFKYFKIEGFSNLQKAYEKGKGILMLTAHFGNWELLTVIAAMTGYPVSIVYRPLDFKPMDQFVENYRSRFGGNLIPKRRSMRHILKSLSQRQMVAVLMDQNMHWEEGVFVDFFGHRACTNKGMAWLALKTGAPVIPVFLVREEKGFKGIFLPEVPLICTGDRIKDIEANTQQYNQIIETMIRQYPEQWLWLHQRWKTRPYHPWSRSPK